MKTWQEPDLLPRRRVIDVGITVVVVTAAGVLSAWLLAGHFHASLGGQPYAGQAAAGQPEEVAAMETSLFEERDQGPPPPTESYESLQRYGWVDEDAGLVRIPIGRAMEIYVERHRNATLGAGGVDAGDDPGPGDDAGLGVEQ
jgi:hypothetical protein